MASELNVGKVVFDNDKNVAGKETGGSERSLAKINTSNFCEYGDIGVNGVEYQTGVFHKFKKNTATFLEIDSAGNVGVGGAPVGKMSIIGGTATAERSHLTFENTAGEKYLLLAVVNLELVIMVFVLST